MNGIITDIKRFAVHDGDGIRTTVFLKGCSLKCIWCHNPEGLSFEKQLAFFEHKCKNCGICLNICRNQQFINNKHTVNFENCNACGKCVEACPNDAFKLYGKNISSQEVFDILKEDIEFYENSNGGITLSGGECLCQPDFCAEILKKCKESNINTAVDTAGYVNQKAIEKVIPYTDIFLYDIKAIDNDVHIKCTGKPNDLILSNLKYIDDMSKKIEIRIPYVPNYNDKEIDKMADFLKNFKNITKVRVLPYHNLAQSKYNSLNYNITLPSKIPTDEEILKALKKFDFINKK